MHTIKWNNRAGWSGHGLYASFTKGQEKSRTVGVPIHYFDSVNSNNSSTVMYPTLPHSSVLV